ncbi:hypothetical protein QEJ31_06255 [Pigmentibacter sp. JX0631]|uniref:hypothetical protein n=1 Tax=Pigmentibacter sp. JX0631 TaxID=2976982 RepID=UPI002468AD59|nr:hypothetical protein [Pigmentibacter sp. JX0631]WGL61198.1 hypothetical protein QEJ31_06255 [Pigmentibacter sp. JX0631]
MSIELLQQENLDLNSLNKCSRKNKIIRRKKYKRKSNYFSKMQNSLELALQEVAYSHSAAVRWTKLCLSYVEFVAPTEASREPARLMRLLAEYPLGLKREELLESFYLSYNECSTNRKESLRICLEKIIQRARTIFSKYDLTIQYSKDTKKYLVMPVFIME